MSERSEQLTDDAISQLLRTRSADPEPSLLDDIVRTVGVTPQDRPWLRLRPVPLTGRALAIVAVALLLATMGAIAVGSGLLLPKPDLGIFQPVAGRIAYEAQNGIWAVDPAASDPTATVQVTSEPGTPLGWSSNGTELLFQKGDENLFVLHADGSETQVTEQLSGFSQIPGSARPSGGSIAPDGSRVVFAGLTNPWRDGRSCHDGALFAVDADGGAPEVLFESRVRQNGIVRDPTFSPDGTQIAFADGYCDHAHSVWVMNADGSDAHQIVTDEIDVAGHVYGLAWSPAGDRIALGFEGGIYTFATDGSDFTWIAGIDWIAMAEDGAGVPFASMAASPYWSPDGSQIAYTTGCTGGDDREGCTLAIADADGTNVRESGVGMSGPWHPGTPSPSVGSTVVPPPSVDATAPPAVGPSSPPGSVRPQSSLEEVPQAEDPVLVEYGFLDGVVTYRAADPLAPSQDGYGDGSRLAIVGLLPDDDVPRRVLLMLADPRPIGPGCAEGPAPADAEALARTIGSDPDFEASAPVAVAIGGISALQMDVLLEPGATSCPWSEFDMSATSPLLLQHAPVFAGADRARLYLLDLPEGPARVLALAVITDEDSFDALLEHAAPIVDSIEFHAP